MSYDLSFDDSFFFAEGEPFDLTVPAVNSRQRPVSVWSAIEMMDHEDWTTMCMELWPDVDPYMVTAGMVLDRIRETNTCKNLNSPVEVYIDPQGIHSVLVWEDDK